MGFYFGAAIFVGCCTWMIIGNGSTKKSTAIKLIVLYVVTIGVLTPFIVHDIQQKDPSKRDVYVYVDGIEDPILMTRTPDSDAISYIGYRKKDEVLVITFRESGDSYYYLNVSPSVWNSFKDSDYLGEYFNDNIKGFYEYGRAS